MKITSTYAAMGLSLLSLALLSIPWSAAMRPDEQDLFHCPLVVWPAPSSPTEHQWTFSQTYTMLPPATGTGFGIADVPYPCHLTDEITVEWNVGPTLWRPNTFAWYNVIQGVDGVLETAVFTSGDGRSVDFGWCSYAGTVPWMQTLNSLATLTDGVTVEFGGGRGFDMNANGNLVFYIDYDAAPAASPDNWYTLTLTGTYWW